VRRRNAELACLGVFGRLGTAVPARSGAPGSFRPAQADRPPATATPAWRGVPDGGDMKLWEPSAGTPRRAAPAVARDAQRTPAAVQRARGYGLGAHNETRSPPARTPCRAAAESACDDAVRSSLAWQSSVAGTAVPARSRGFRPTQADRPRATSTPAWRWGVPDGGDMKLWEPTAGTPRRAAQAVARDAQRTPAAVQRARGYGLGAHIEPDRPQPVPPAARRRSLRVERKCEKCAWPSSCPDCGPCSGALGVVPAYAGRQAACHLDPSVAGDTGRGRYEAVGAHGRYPPSRREGRCTRCTTHAGSGSARQGVRAGSSHRNQIAPSPYPLPRGGGVCVWRGNARNRAWPSSCPGCPGLEFRPPMRIDRPPATSVPARWGVPDGRRLGADRPQRTPLGQPGRGRHVSAGLGVGPSAQPIGNAVAVAQQRRHAEVQVATGGRAAARGAPPGPAPRRQVGVRARRPAGW
jgi:hypothetical protein